MSDWPHQLHAYLHGPEAQAIVAWLKERIPELELKPILESERPDEPSFSAYDDPRYAVVLEEHHDVGWFGLDVMSADGAEAFAGWDSVRLGKALVDALDGVALVEGGPELADPSMDFVRVTRQALDLVIWDEIGAPIDEQWTKPIAKRPR